MTEIDSIIQPGQPIPDDVTDMADAQNPTEDWPRWVRHHKHGGWDFWTSPEHAERWRSDPDREGRPSVEVVTDGREMGWAPFRVLAVREQPAEPEPDVLDLVRQYGEVRVFALAATNAGQPPAAAAHTAVAAELFGRIEAEVERLRDTASLAEMARAEADWPLLEALGLSKLTDVLPAIERLKAAQPDPLVLSLPTVPRVFEVPQSPQGITRVRDSQDEVWELDGCGGLWHCDKRGWPLPWHLLLADHGPLTEVMREPRTWSRLDVAPEDLKTVDVAGHGRWTYTGGAGFDGAPMFDQAGTRCTLARLRELGDVTEVFDDKDSTL